MTKSICLSWRCISRDIGDRVNNSSLPWRDQFPRLPDIYNVDIYTKGKSCFSWCGITLNLENTQVGERHGFIKICVQNILFVHTYRHTHTLLNLIQQYGTILLFSLSLSSYEENCKVRFITIKKDLLGQGKFSIKHRFQTNVRLYLCF